MEQLISSKAHDRGLYLQASSAGDCTRLKSPRTEFQSETQPNPDRQNSSPDYGYKHIIYHALFILWIMHLAGIANYLQSVRNSIYGSKLVCLSSVIEVLVWNFN